MATAPLFESVCFHILQEHLETENKEELATELRHVLIEGGGLEEPFISHLVTHIIADKVVDDTDSIKGDDCQAVVINSKWVLISSQNGSLLPIAPFESQEVKIFTGVVACPTGVSNDDKHKLHALVLYYGGEFQRTLDERVTHLIAVEPQGVKYSAAIDHGIQVVKPEWVLECIRRNKQLPVDDYLLDQTTTIEGAPLLVETLQITEGDSSMVIPPSSNQISNEVLTQEQGQSSTIDDVRIESSVPIEDHITRNEDYRSLGRVMKESESPPLLDKDMIASTPQETTTHHQSLSSKNEDTLLQGMVFMILDYSELLNQQTLAKWNEVIMKHGGQTVLPPDSAHKCTHILSQNIDSQQFHKVYHESMCLASAHWLNDVLSEQRMFPPRNPLHFPVVYESTPAPCYQLSLSITNYCGKERDIVRDMIRISGLAYTGHLCPSVTHLICKRPEGRKYDKALEWGVVVVNSTFVSDIMHNGSIPVSTSIDRYSKLNQSDEFTSPCSEMVKYMRPWQHFMMRYSNHHLIDQDSCQQLFIHLDTTSSIIHHSSIPCNKGIVIMFTGYNPATLKRLKSVCKSIHADTTSDPKKCTHLLAPRIARTVKFLCAISICKYILSSDWLEESRNKGSLVDEKDYVLQDAEGEEAFSMSISRSLERAAERKLLDGLAVHITRNVVPDFDSFKLIIECGGGKVYTQSDLQSIYGRKYERLAAVDGQLLIVVSCMDDVSAGLCSEFYQRRVPVYSAEFILTGILQQSLTYDKNKLQQ